MKSLLHRKKKNAPLITTRTRTHKNARAHEFTQANKCILTHMQRTRTRVHTHTHTHTNPWSPEHGGCHEASLAHKYTHKQTKAQTHTRTSTHTKNTNTQEKPGAKTHRSTGVAMQHPFLTNTQADKSTHGHTHTYTEHTHLRSRTQQKKR